MQRSTSATDPTLTELGQTSTEEQAATAILKDLQGLSEETWGGHVLLEKELLLPVSVTRSSSQGSSQPTPRTRIKGVIKYPISPDRPPIEVWILSKDFGKRGLKGGGVSPRGYFKTTVIPDAYSAANENMQQERIIEESAEALYTWRIQEHGDRSRIGERFVFGNPALRISEALAVNEDVSSRLADERTRDALYASLVLDLIELGCAPTVMEGDTEVTKKYAIVIPLGIPANDLKDSKTHTAAEQLKGTFSIEQYNVATGKTVTWLIEVIGVILEAQAKGTVFAVTRKLNGQPAVKKKVITVIDIGGGDAYEVEIDVQGGLLSIPKRLGDGTIMIARPLIAKVEKAHGLQISEIEAQEALYKKTIWKGGEEISIAPLIEELRPRFANLLTKLTITNRMLSTFILFTGGGAALLEQEIRARLQAKSDQLQEGVDFLIMPPRIAAIANGIGLFAIGYYKVQTMIREYVSAYLDLSTSLVQLQQKIQARQHSVQRWPDEQQPLSELYQQQETLHLQLSRHVGQYYPEVQKHMLAQRQRQQAQTEHTAGER